MLRAMMKNAVKELGPSCPKARKSIASASMEMFEVVDEYDRVIGKAPRSECHGNPALIHRTAHVVVSDGHGKLLLQKRSGDKDIQPGKWDTAVGGHLDPGEDYLAAAVREMQEELGIPAHQRLEFLFDLRIRNEIESENTRVFKTVYAGPFNVDRHEIDEIRFWTTRQLTREIGKGVFTPNLESEISLLIERGLL